MTAYAIVITELPAEDGGGYLGAAPDLPGCLSDGATPEEALRNAQAAIEEWLSAARAIGRPIPLPGSAAERARTREQALIGAIKAFSEDDPTADARLARLGRAIDRLGAVIDASDSWAHTARRPSRRPARSAVTRSARG
jgi:predicted RNase H-like HicB family nuclease